MEPRQEKFILDLLRRHRYMAVATVRPDGFPQVTTVGYANDGFDLYFSCDRTSQKVKNIRRCDKVAAAINREYRDWRRIRGLNLGGHARILRGRERQAAWHILAAKFPDMRDFPASDPAIAFVRVRPVVISLLDYSVAFGHTELVAVPGAA
ncbi:MAG: pyridoxamine 5'-phosphate oxidase family protein [Burkholderiales bacterium]